MNDRLLTEQEVIETIGALPREIAGIEMVDKLKKAQDAKSVKAVIEEIGNWNCGRCEKRNDNNCLLFHKSCPWWQSLKEKYGV